MEMIISQCGARVEPPITRETTLNIGRKGFGAHFISGMLRPIKSTYVVSIRQLIKVSWLKEKFNGS